MLNILKNDYCRIRPRLTSVLIMLAVTLSSIFLAVYLTGRQQMRGHIAVISQNPAAAVDTEYLSVETLKEKPAFSELVRQKYDAYVIDKGNGEFEIETLRSSDFKNELQMLLKNPKAKISADKSKRGVGVNIMGFLMTFLGLGGFFYMFPFAEDKEEGQLERITASPLSFPKYLFMHCVFCLSSFLPVYLMIAVLKAAGWNIGFSLLQYAALFLLLTVLIVSFALLLNTFFKKPDNANMLGNSIIVVTSTLAGCFYSFSKNNTVLDNVIKFLPQKQFLNFAQDIQNGNSAGHLLPVFYILAVALIFFIIAFTKLKHDFVEKA